MIHTWTHKFTLVRVVRGTPTRYRAYPATLAVRTNYTPNDDETRAMADWLRTYLDDTDPAESLRQALSNADLAAYLLQVAKGCFVLPYSVQVCVGPNVVTVLNEDHPDVPPVR